MMSSIHYLPRVRRLRSLLEEKDADVAVIVEPSNVFYFTGYRGAGYLVVARDRAALAVPVLEYLHALDYLREAGLLGSLDLLVFKPYGLPQELIVAEEKEARLVEGGIEALVKEYGGEGGRCGSDTSSLSMHERIAKHCKAVERLSDMVTRMRMVKEPWEVERIKTAASIAEAALEEAVNALEYGVSEAEVAAVIEYAIRVNGGEGPSFPPIVAFGRNTVYPHAFPSRSRVLTKPSPVLIDLGAIYGGYCSDMTRTLFYGGSPAEFRHAAEAVHEALEAAIDRVAPGVTTGELDATARKVLESYGLAKYFIHSLGHGVGIDIHEAPRVTYTDKTVLEPGMVITIEPGVYIPGKLGVRIEELILVTHRGAERLTRYETWLWQ